jgi:hypothetical protein
MAFDIDIATPPIKRTPTTITAIVLIRGGEPPFTYLWQDGTTSDTCTQNIASENTFTCIVTGSDNVTATSELTIKN